MHAPIRPNSGFPARWRSGRARSFDRCSGQVEDCPSAMAGLACCPTGRQWLQAPTGIPDAFRRVLETIDMPEPGGDAGPGSRGGKTPTGCHWNGLAGNTPVRSAAPSATARQTGSLRVFRTSLTSTSAFCGRPVRMEAALGATCNSHAAAADAIDFHVLRHHEPHNGAGHARDGTAHGSFRSLSTPLRLPSVLNAVRNDGFRPQIGPYARSPTVSSQFSYPPWRMLLSSGEDMLGTLSAGPAAYLQMIVDTTGM